MGVSFNITVINDNLLNGARDVTVTPSGVPGYTLLAGSVEVRDDEVGTLAIALPASVTEGAGTLSGQSSVTITDHVADQDIVVQLASGNTSKISVPATVTIPAGQNSAAFPMTVLDDSYVDGQVDVTLTASVGGWTPVFQTVAVLDNEPTTISLSIATAVREDNGNFSGTVAFAGTVKNNVVVQLTSSNPSRLTVPASVTVPAGSSGTQFYDGQVINDNLKNGRETIHITASAPGFQTLIKDVFLKDDDVASLEWGQIPTFTAGDLVPVSVYGKTIDGDPARLINLPVSEIGATRGGATVPVLSSGFFPRE